MMIVMASSPGQSPRPSFAIDEERWLAVRTRDRRADGTFYYSVQTTGVFCRPSCGARLPRREHVRFHRTCEEAERDGFRPCKRCRPKEPDLTAQRTGAIARACRLIDESEEPPSLNVLAGAAGLSRFHFHRTFKAVTGLTPRAYAAAQRARRVREALASGATVTEAIYSAGFNSSGRFYASSAAALGMPPKTYKSGGAGMIIRFAAGECSLGSILVAATGQGVCAILLGDRPDALVRELQDTFPNAELTAGDSEFERIVATVVGFVEAPALGLGLPLDVRGTAFQQRVWQALRELAPGSTATYAEVARRIGTPTAVRAVARACAANRIAVAIPCHRIVRQDGSPSGYRWGIDRKHVLLEREAAS